MALTWATPADLTYGAPLTATQLNAEAPIAGTFSYTPPAGTRLHAGDHDLSVTFTPTDSSYGAASLTRCLTILPAPLLIRPVDTQRAVGQANPSFIWTATGLVNDDVTPDTPPVCTTTANQASPIGTYAITASGASDPDYTISYAPGSLDVVAAPSHPSGSAGGGGGGCGAGSALGLLLMALAGLALRKRARN